MDEAKPGVLAYMTFPRKHRAKLHSTNPIKRLNGEVKRGMEVVGIFPSGDAIIRLVGAILLEQNNEWAVQRARYMKLEAINQMSDGHLVCPQAVAICSSWPKPVRLCGQGRQLNHGRGRYPTDRSRLAKCECNAAQTCNMNTSRLSDAEKLIWGCSREGRCFPCRLSSR
jgi:hypothetical protein